MSFYECQGQNIWINLDQLEAFCISEIADGYEVRGCLPHGQGWYMMEKFDSFDESRNCVLYLLGEMSENV